MANDRKILYVFLSAMIGVALMAISVIMLTGIEPAMQYFESLFEKRERITHLEYSCLSIQVPEAWEADSSDNSAHFYNHDNGIFITVSQCNNMVDVLRKAIKTGDKRFIHVKYTIDSREIKGVRSISKLPGVNGELISLLIEPDIIIDIYVDTSANPPDAGLAVANEFLNTQVEFL